MPYLNPYTALSVPTALSPEAEAAWLRQEKKRLLAEFELKDSSVVSIGGQELDKSGLLTLFAQLEDPDRRSWHRQVQNQPALQAFLEAASLDLFYEGKVAALAAQPEAFRAFIAPHFAESFNQRLFHAYRQRDAEEIAAMCTEPLPLPLTHHAACYRDTFRYLHQQVKEAEALAQAITQGQAPGGDIQEMCDEWVIGAINQLPAYFQVSRDRYALALEGLAMGVHNTHRRVKLSLFILRQGLKLRLSPEAAGRLQHLLDQLLEMAPAEAILDQLTGSGKSRWSGWWIAAGVGTLLVLALLLL